MGNGMMNHPEISELFAVVVLAVCFVFVSNIVFVLWRKRKLLTLLKRQHSTMLHSLPMSLSMISTMVICTVSGALLTNNLSFAYILGFLIGIVVSGVISSPLYDIAIIDGLVAGAMGGLMGTMLGAMIPLGGLYTISILLTLLFIVSWMTMLRRLLKIESSNTKMQQRKKAN